MMLSETFIPSSAKEVFDFVSVQAIPGAVLMAIIHFVLILPFGKRIWLKQRNKVTCC